MAAEPVVPARWAVLSKPPADGGDYRVLACSEGPAAFAEFEHLVRDNLYGTPAQWTQLRQPGENLPWIAFGVSGDGVRAPRRVSVSVTDWQVQTGSSWDSVRRRSMATQYFSVRYDDLARHAVGLTGLWDAVRPVALPPEGTAGGVELRLAADPLARLAQLLDEQVDFEWAAATAAAALTVPVGLVARWSRFALTRIETMDAVLSLLPYGHRAVLTAATWAPEPLPARPWLCYTHPSPSSSRLLVHEGLSPRPPGGAARAHLARLRSLRERAGTLGVLREMAAAAQPPAAPAAGPDGPTGDA